MTKAEAIAADLSRFLNRYSPPRVIADDKVAMQDEVDAMTKQLLRFAPRDGYSEFVADVLEGVAVKMTHRSWPSIGDLVAVCRDEVARRSTGVNTDQAEVSIVSRMAGWFEKNGGQMPGFGRPSRTAALISGGFLRDERFARFMGFDLDDEQRDRARSQRMSPEEWDQHTRVIARLRGISQHEAKAQERERAPLTMPDDPVKRFGGAA